MAVRRKAGDVRDVLASVVLVQLDGQPECAISALTDITARKRAEAERDRLIEQSQAAHERLGALSRRLLMVQEEERRRLAIELHDELGQLLTAVKINLESLARSAAGASPAQLEGAIGSVDHAMLRMRELALDLRPSVLDDLGLPPALRWYADRFARHSGIEAHVSIDAVPGLEPGVATACFRVVQEALTNVARHARARRVWVELRFDGLGLELSVRDDGCGFDVAAARTRALQGVSMGLLGMQERVTLAGGHFDLRAEPGVGTVLRACFPLSPQSGGPA
jgi:two-component system sensor histidine kinase UhpB